MATLSYSCSKNTAYGAGASASDPYFGYQNVSYSLSDPDMEIGNLTVTAITGASLSLANTNGSSSGNYTMEIQIQLNGTWYKIGSITTTTKTSSHKTWSDFASSADASLRSLMGKAEIGGIRGKVTAGYFHVNSGSEINITCTIVSDYTGTTIALDRTSVNAGSAIQVNITQADNSCTYGVTWSFGDDSQYDSLAAGVRTKSFTVPLDWLENIPNATSGVATVVVQTYKSGTLKGTASKNFTIVCPVSVIPSITDFTADRIDNDIPYSWGVYIERHSQAELYAYGEGAYGSTITGYQISGGGWSAAADTLTTGVFQTAGTYTFTAKVTDSRGRVATQTLNIVVESYSQPAITETISFRCDSAGVESENGTYGSFQMTFTFDTRRSNAVETLIEYKLRSSGTWLTLYSSLMVSGTPVVVNGDFDTTKSYDIRYTLSDVVQSTQATDSISTAMYTIHLKPNGKGAAFGKLAELEKAVEVTADWDFFVYGKKLADYIFPVGSVYQNVNGNNPASLFGGTWASVGTNTWKRTS